ncbi:unnamed protein product [Rodentolepis nana]|uniref:Protein FAM228A n=1 Tax=Rodentolepis nana TaxID=102285 RepID=A0A0R3TKE9_RODNA|nr:unnamed protein product [Rodentolepis nana]
MGRSYPADTQSQRALQEVYEKEELAAIKFFLAHHKPDEEVTKKSATVKEIFQLEIPQKYIKLMDEKTHRKIKKQSEATTKELLPSTEEIPLMRPPSSSIYLKQRLKLNPDERYEMPVTSAMEYGWKLFEVFPKSEITHPRYGRISTIQKSFFRNGSISLKMGEDML